MSETTITETVHSTKHTTMQPTCSLIRRPIRRNPWRKWITITAEIIGGILTIALLTTLTILALAL